MKERRASGSRQRVGVKEVAEDAGVSTASVSRVLSKSGYASAALRERVHQSAQRLGYQPDAFARGLRMQQGRSLGILVPDLTNPVTLSFIRGVQHVAQHCAYAVLIGDAQRDVEIERNQLAFFDGQRMAAIIVAGPLQDRAGTSVVSPEIPIVYSPSASDTDSVGEDAAIENAVGDLARHGHRSVVFVSRSTYPDPRGADTRTARRRQAVVAAAKRYGIAVAHCSTPATLSTSQTARRLARYVGPRQATTHAVICASHQLAPQLLGGIAAMRLTIPGEVSFVSFGDSEWAQAYRPAIAVIRFDRYQEARQLTHELLSDLGETTPSEAGPVAPEYVSRPSVGPCPS